MTSARNADKTKRSTKPKVTGKPKPSALRETIEALAWALVITTLLRGFVIQSFTIPSPSMVPTLLVGDYLFVNRFLYGPMIPFTHTRLPAVRQPRTGDVIVFQYPGKPSEDWIKRVVATGGQTVEVRNKHVFIDGKPSAVADAHVQHIDPEVTCGPWPAGAPYPEDASLKICRDNFGPFRVPEGRLFVMGDNRENSADSRYWGTVPLYYVKGPAMFLYWSWDGEKFMPRFDRLFRAIH